MQGTKLFQIPAYKTVWATINSSIEGKGLRPDASEDPLAGTAGVTLSSEEIRRVAKHLLQLGTLEADRELITYMWCLVTIGRSDDFRLIFLADFLAPRCIKSIGIACCSVSACYACKCHCTCTSRIHCTSTAAHGLYTIKCYACPTMYCCFSAQ